MARFSVYRWRDAYVVDCQADLLASLPTRFVVPLLRAPPAAGLPKLNPEVQFAGQRLVFTPQLATTLTLKELRNPIGSIADLDYQLTTAIDLLLSGV